ncbi:MAG: hypothetical protein A3F11_05275 [Gammaproteobacteria bacterium RIFCSPHIGHO2_12_FULL_37_14]|nr:MAG: hypothetical protein A3F11_05275 [Gammaproteobacteria bacterium RIFCSPHIGHO2_12_FULL_37_14]
MPNLNKIVTYSQGNLDKWNRKEKEDAGKIAALSQKISVYDQTCTNLSARTSSSTTVTKHLRLRETELQGFRVKADGKRQKLEKNIEFYRKHQLAAIDFLKNLTVTPMQAFTDLRNNIETLFIRYDRTHLIQDVRVRLCLNGLKERLDLIAATLDSKDDDAAWRIRYVQLCGFLYDLHQQYINENTNIEKDLLEIFVELLNRCHVEWNADLPDKLATGSNCFDHFTSFEDNGKAFVSRFHLTEDQLFEAEKRAFNNAIQALSDKQLSSEPVLSKQLSNLINSVKEKVSGQEKKYRAELKANEAKESFLHRATHKPEYHLSTRLITLVHQVFFQPSNHQDSFLKLKRCNDGHPSDHPISSDNMSSDVALDCLIQLSPYLAGKPSPHSTRQKVLGAVIALIGAAIVAASVVTALATFGVSTPLSATTLAIGTSLLWHAGSIAAAVVGVGITGSGMGKFASSMPQGEFKYTKQIIDDEQAKKRDVFRSFR